MDTVNKSNLFLDEILVEVARKDRLHSKKIDANINFMREHHAQQFAELLFLVYSYFNDLKISPVKISEDYLRMINDMRAEGIFFIRHGKYRCENQGIAYQNVYSNAAIMLYYMNALLISQILWKHHFKIFAHFEKSLKSIFPNRESELKILDVGPGHGFFSFIVKKYFTRYERIDIVDISETSLTMTKKIIGFDGKRINYFLKDIFEYEDSNKYDLILLGEVLEHLDNPGEILVKLSMLLSKDGVLWITTPTNSPAIDHVYLFNSRDEVISLVEESQLGIVDSCHFYAEDVDDQTATKNRVTDLVGVFCKKSNR